MNTTNPPDSNAQREASLFTVILNEQQIRTLVRLSVDNKRMWQQVIERESMSGGRLDSLNNAKRQLIKAKHIISSLRRALAYCAEGQSQVVEIPKQVISDNIVYQD